LFKITNCDLEVFLLFLPLHLRRDPACGTQCVEPDEARGVVLVAGFGFGFHRGIQQTPIAFFGKANREAITSAAEPAANCDIRKRYFPISNTTTS
jgi:hypothetical protein